MTQKITYPGTSRLRRLPRIVGRRLGRREWFRWTMRPMVRVPADRQWVFILGCYNGGTTLLHDLIARSASCARLPGEGVFLTSELVAPEALGWTRMWWKVRDELVRREAAKDPDAGIVRKDWCFWYDTGRPVFLEKSCSDVLRIAWLDRSFPGAKFITLTRNGYAVAEGIRRRAGDGYYPLPDDLARYPIEWCARQWTATCAAIEEGVATLNEERVLRLRYEDLCREPREWTARIGSFLGLADLGDQPLDHVRDMNGGAIARLSTDDIAAINGVAGADLSANGYVVLQPSDGGTDDTLQGAVS
jgi:Sulfotransferase family